MGANVSVPSNVSGDVAAKFTRTPAPQPKRAPEVESEEFRYKDTRSILPKMAKPGFNLRPDPRPGINGPRIPTRFPPKVPPRVKKPMYKKGVPVKVDTSSKPVTKFNSLALYGTESIVIGTGKNSVMVMPADNDDKIFKACKANDPKMCSEYPY